MIEKRTIIVGDVHGCFDEFQELLKKASYSPLSDRLILVGDLVNKGPKSIELLKYARANNIECVLGNHEMRLLELIDQSEQISRPKSSLTSLIEEMGANAGDWRNWISKWPLFINEPDFLVVHAGLHPTLPPEKTDARILATIRTWDGQGLNLNCPDNPAWHELYTEKKLVIYGHWAIQGLCIRPNSIGLDSGCVYGRELSAVILPERQIVQVKAREAYAIL